MTSGYCPWVGEFGPVYPRQFGAVGRLSRRAPPVTRDKDTLQQVAALRGSSPTVREGLSSDTGALHDSRATAPCVVRLGGLVVQIFNHQSSATHRPVHSVHNLLLVPRVSPSTDTAYCHVVTMA